MASDKRVYVVGVGMGNPGTLTAEGKAAIEASQLLIGAERLLEAFPDTGAEKRALTHSDEIVEAVRGASAETVAVLMSGDTGFFSGTALVTGKLADAGIQARVIPGISSLSYFSARLQIPWGDAKIVSAHGRDANVAGEVQSHPKTFVLTGGKTKAEDLCRLLCERGLPDVTVHAGERLSYDDERIVSGTAEALAKESFADLTVLLVENPHPIRREFAAPSLSDDEFTRSQAPMTKEEIRELAMAKLQIRPDDVVWDIGAGTGSTSVEAALAARKGRVLAIEKNHEAIATLKRNKERFGATNIEIVEGLAPDALEGIAAPDRVFIGGTSGHLVEIVNAALAANPHVRIVANGVTLEMARETLRCIEECAVKDVEVAQVAVAKSHEVGPYHMMYAKNPVLVFSCNGDAEALAGDGGARDAGDSAATGGGALA